MKSCRLGKSVICAVPFVRPQPTQRKLIHPYPLWLLRLRGEPVRDISAAAWRLAFLRAVAPALRHLGEQYRENPRPGGTLETPQTPQRAFWVPFACLSARQLVTARRFASARHPGWTLRGRPRPRPFGLYGNGWPQIWHSFGEKSGEVVILGTFVRFNRFGNAVTWTVSNK
jgi:hypothetical protein